MLMAVGDDLSGSFDVLLNYGAIGAMLVISVLFMWYLHRQSNQRADQQIAQAEKHADYARARAEKLETQLGRQNEVIQEKVIPLAASLSDAAQLFTSLTDRIVSDIERQETQ